MSSNLPTTTYSGWETLMTRFFRLCLLASMCFVLLTPISASAATPEWTYETAVLTYTNANRTDRDLHALKINACVDRYAERQARRMRDARKLYHQNMSPIMTNCGLKSVGENIAYGYSSGRSVVNAWMRSSGHRANILKSSYRLMGVGAVRDSRGVWWVSQVFGTAK